MLYDNACTSPFDNYSIIQSSYTWLLHTFILPGWHLSLGPFTKRPKKWGLCLMKSQRQKWLYLSMLKHERQNWYECGLTYPVRMMYSNRKDTFRTHIKKPGSTEQIVNIFTQKAIIKDLLLGEWIKSDREGGASYDILYMWNRKRNDTNELTKQKETHRLREWGYSCRGKG